MFKVVVQESTDMPIRVYREEKDLVTKADTMMGVLEEVLILLEEAEEHCEVLQDGIQRLTERTNTSQ